MIEIQTDRCHHSIPGELKSSQQDIRRQKSSKQRPVMRLAGRRVPGVAIAAQLAGAFPSQAQPTDFQSSPTQRSLWPAYRDIIKNIIKSSFGSSDIEWSDIFARGLTQICINLDNQCFETENGCLEGCDRGKPLSIRFCNHKNIFSSELSVSVKQSFVEVKFESSLRAESEENLGLIRLPTSIPPRTPGFTGLVDQRVAAFRLDRVVFFVFETLKSCWI